MPDSFADVLDALTGKFCITWGVVELAMWRRRVPWRWPRLVPKWFLELKREIGFEKVSLKERKIKMLGNAQFTYDVKENRIVSLDFEDGLQPHSESEHDIFEAIVRAQANRTVTANLSVEGGLLKVKFSLPVPALEKDPETGKIMLASEMEAKRQEAAAAAEAAKKEAEEAASANAQQPGPNVDLEHLAAMAGRAGAAAAHEVLKNAAQPAEPASPSAS